MLPPSRDLVDLHSLLVIINHVANMMTFLQLMRDFIPSLRAQP